MVIGRIKNYALTKGLKYMRIKESDE